MKRARHKFNAVRTRVGDREYDSKMEAAYAEQLAARQAAGDIVGWLEQVPLRLPGGVKYTVDFLVFESDGTCRAIEVKGAETEAWKVRHAVAGAAYPWLPVEVVFSEAAVRAKAKKKAVAAAKRTARKVAR